MPPLCRFYGGAVTPASFRTLTFAELDALLGYMREVQEAEQSTVEQARQRG